MATEGRSLTYLTDSAYVQKGLFRLRPKARWKPNRNKDLWTQVRRLAQGRDIEIIKVESHATDAEFERVAKTLDGLVMGSFKYLTVLLAVQRNCGPTEPG